MKKLSEKLAFEFVQQADTQSCEHKAFKPYKIRVANAIFSNCPVCHKLTTPTAEACGIPP
jgi:cytochrome c2